MKKEDLYEWAKIISSYDTSIVIDKITDEWVYTSGWNLSLKVHDRLFRPMSQIMDMLSNWIFKRFDTKITISIQEIYKKFPEYKWLNIEWYTKFERDDKDILEWKLNKWDKLFLKSKPQLYRNVLWVDIENNICTVWLFLDDVNQTWFDMHLKELYELYSFTSWVISKTEIANKLNLISANLLTITD